MFWVTLLLSSLLSLGGASAPDGPVVLAYGDSLTAGLGIAEEDAWPALPQARAAQSFPGLKVVNAGVSGDTSAGGLRRLNWSLRRPVDVVILALGANDGLRGIDPDTTRANLQAIIDGIRAKYPDAALILAGMTLPPNLGRDYIGRFEAVFTDLAETNNLPLIPFLLAGVAGDPALNQADGIHPTEAGHRIVADTVWPFLQRALAESSEKARPSP